MSAAPLILAVECATRGASVAIVRGAETLSLRSGTSDQHHAEGLLAEVDAALREAAVGLDDLEAFAVTVGPGAFTSLRIGLATVKGLAFGSRRPVAAVSTLAVIAQAAPADWPRVAAVLDARRGELYVWQGCRLWRRLPAHEDALQAAADVLAVLVTNPVVAGAARAFAAALASRCACASSRVSSRAFALACY